MRVLVTGLSGYIGSVLLPFLQSAGHTVTGFDAGLYAQCGFGQTPPPRPNRRDVRDVEPTDLENIDAVVHLAALSNDPLGDLDASLTYQINHGAAVRLAEAAKTAGVERFIFASSCSLYGASGKGLIDETVPFAPVTPYGKSKAMVEDDLNGLADDDFSPVSLRNATVYGVSPGLRLDIVVNNLTAWAIATGQIVLLSDGTPWRPQVHVEDACRALLAVLEAPRAIVHNQAFNVGKTEENYQVRELAAMVSEAVPGSRLSIADDAGPDPRSYRVDFSKLPSLVPAFKPEWDVPRGIRQLAEAFTEARLAEADFPRYTRLKEVRRLLESGQLSPELRWT